MSEKNYKMIRYGICFLFTALLCYLFPYSGDDWAWGSQIGIDRLNVWFADYNGRYVGNLIEIAMTHSNLIKTLVMALGLTGIIYLAERISGHPWAFYVTLVCLILMPRPVLRQAVIWTAGYSNYVTSIFFTLVFIAYVYPIFQREMPKRKLWHCIPLLVLGVISTLIVEHITIYNVVLSVGVIIYTIAAHRRIIASHAAYFLGAVAGTVYMFSNGAYHSIANNQDEYRQMAKDDIIGQSIQNYVQIITRNLTLVNVCVNLAILIVCFLLFRQCIAITERKWVRYIGQCCLIVMTAFNAWALLSYLGIYDYTKQDLLLYTEAILVIIYILALIIFCIQVGLRKKCLWKLLFWNAGILCVTAPLLVVNPIGERCFFATYILFILLLLELGTQLEGNTVSDILNGKLLRQICISISVAGLAFYLNIFTSIHQADCDRLERIRQQVADGKTSVEILYLPYEEYVWTATPTEEAWAERYKLFYGLPEDLELKAVWEYSEEKK